MAEEGLTAQPPPPPPPPPVEPGGEGSDYPLRITVSHREEYGRFLPLVKWLLAFPHYIALIVVGIAAFFAYIVAWFATVITGRFPEGLFNFVVGVQRWGFRVSAYLTLLTDAYPPFSLADDADYPARYEIDYPADGVARWRPFFAWLVALPYFFVGYFLMLATYVCLFVAFFAILFTKHFPPGLFRIVVGSARWQQRAGAYAGFLVTKYPPFSLE